VPIVIILKGVSAITCIKLSKLTACLNNLALIPWEARSVTDTIPSLFWSKEMNNWIAETISCTLNNFFPVVFTVLVKG
jgi:hypothetical protein